MTATETTRKESAGGPSGPSCSREVVTSGLCTGCAGCVVACPHDVLGYDDTNGVYRPFHLEDELGPGDCGHGQRGLHQLHPGLPPLSQLGDRDRHLPVRARARARRDARASARTSSWPGPPTRSCSATARTAAWSPPSCCGAWSTTASTPRWCRSSRATAAPGRPMPGLARTREEILAVGRVPLHLLGQHPRLRRRRGRGGRAAGPGRDELPVVGARQSCGPARPARSGRRLALSIGLLCSKTFDDAIFEELFEAKYGLARADIVKMNIKGVFQIWMRDGSYHEIPLKECHAWTREGCKTCPDFAAEHADISTGGIGAFNDWTLTLVRTDAGPGGHRRHARGRGHRDPPGRRRSGGHRPAAQAVDGVAPALARDGRRRASAGSGRQAEASSSPTAALGPARRPPRCP